MNTAQVDWMRKYCNDHTTDGKIPWKKIKRIVNYGVENDNYIPVWYNKDGTQNAVDSKTKANNFLNYIHRFDEDEMSEENGYESNEEYDNIIKNYRNKNKNKFGTEMHKKEIIDLNKLMQKDELRRLIKSFSKNKAGNSDKSRYVLFKKGIDIIDDSMCLCYNIMFLLGIRPHFMNLRDISVVHKSSKKKKFMDSYRPVSVLSSCANPYDKWMAGKYLRYGIRMKIIRCRHFGFIKGLGCIDAVSFLLEIVWNNRVYKYESHMVFLDFKAAFDTIHHVMLIQCMEINIGIEGFALTYLVIALEYRNGRVIVNGFYSEWKQDICGVPQGWPPSPICFIFFTIEFDVINELNLGVELIAYADDNTLISNGKVKGDQLEKNMQLSMNLIGYIAKKKKLFMQIIKQNYMVISHIKDINSHKNLYFDLDLYATPITKNYSSVRYLGLLIDWKLDWNQQYDNTINNARRIFVNIFNKYRNANDILASHIVLIYKAYVFPKLWYGSELWYNEKHEKNDELLVVFNDMVRQCTGADRTTPLKWIYVQLGETDLNNIILGKKSILWSRLLRSPDSNILHKIIQNDYWLDWKKERDKIANDDYDTKTNIDDNIYYEYDTEIKIDDSNYPINYKNIDIQNQLIRHNMNNDWVFKENVCNDEDFDNEISKKRKKINGRYHIFYEILDAAKDINNSDWNFIKDINYHIIPKRLSYNLSNLIIPDNVFYHKSEDDSIKLSFSIDWILHWVDNCYVEDINGEKKIDWNLVQLIFTDGSNKEAYGGCGYFTTDLKYYLDNCDIKKFREKQMNVIDLNPYNKISSFWYGVKFTGIRSSIDHCELDAVIHCLAGIYKCFFDIYENDVNLVPKEIFIIIDNEVVVKWIVGEYITNDVLVYKKLEEIYKWILDLQDYDLNINIMWVKAHNEEKGNELADWLAKAGMISGYISKNWKELEKIYNENEWMNYGYKAIKKENKRKVKNKMISAWNTYKYDRNEAENVLCKNLIDWNIGPHPAYRIEMRNINYGDWKRLCQLRSGHSNLNGQKKFGFQTKICENMYCNNNKIETTQHYLMECEEYTAIRNDLLEVSKGIYDEFRNIEIKEEEKEEKKDNLRFDETNSNEKLEFILFPFQKQLINREIREKKRIYNMLMGKRLFILDKLNYFVRKSDRFKIEYVGS